MSLLRGLLRGFPALEPRLNFSESDIAYLSNLCHNCGACYYSCQYAPPHEFQLNFPKLLANVRVETYQKYAWPSALGGLFRRNGMAVSVVMVVVLTLVLAAMSAMAGGTAMLAPHPLAEGAFYAIVPHGVMAASFGIVFALATAALALGAIRFWRDTGGTRRDVCFARPLRSVGGRRDAPDVSGWRRRRLRVSPTHLPSRDA